MSSNKVLFLVFGVLALVFAVSMSSAVGEEDSDAISDRRFRWASSEEDSDESDAQDVDDAEDDDDQSDNGDTEEIEIWVEEPASDESSQEESGSYEA